MIDPVVLAQALIRCPSVTPADAGALGVVANALTPFGFRTERMRFRTGDGPAIDNLYARAGAASGPLLCFAGHTDVVPPGDATAWRFDPFGGIIAEDRLWGRGACDMKGAVAAFAAAAAAFVSARGPDFGGAVALLITGDEEADAVDGTRRVLEALDARGERIDACIVGEPTNPRRLGQAIKIGRRGSLTGHLTVDGVQGHTAYPDQADNPLPRLIAMLSALAGAELDRGTAQFEPSRIALTTIDVGNPTSNVIPAQGRATFNIRFNDRHTGDSLAAWLRQTLDAVGGAYTLTLRRRAESFLTPPGGFADLVADAVERVTGLRPERSTDGGTSDACFVKDYAPVVEFGLVNATIHKTDEHAALADIRLLGDVYRAVLDDFFPAR
jgi:succinyl-diaminopimelate desuccinylase